MLSLWLLALVLRIGSSAPTAGEDPVVETRLGKVRGYTSTSRAGKQFFAFTGIPYAKPPVGNLRFQPPVPSPPWKGIKDATKDGPMCMQTRPFYNLSLAVGEEDCLHLSVFTRNVSGNAPVLVHFHGGAFTSGYGVYHRPEFLMDEDIVIVKVEYRLGIFGFLSFGTPEMPGNQGLKDQLLALKWVQKNVRSFGGNPGLVTINGESAGGASIYHHTISPLSRGLFHRAIAESGASYGSWAVAPKDFRRTVAERVMTALGCPTRPSAAISCVMKKKPEEIFAKAEKITAGGPGSEAVIQFGPTFEEAGPGAFLVGPPTKWQHSPVPFLMGTTSGEGLMFTMRYLAKNFDWKSFFANYNKMAPYILGYFNSASNPDKVTKEIRKFYLAKDEITVKDFANLTMVASDSLFTIPIMEGADNHKGDVYFYYFDYKSPFPGIDDKYNIGAFHCAESRFIWNVTYNMPLVHPKEIELSKTLVKVVGNFMRTGVPTIAGSNIKWKKWTPKSHNYIKVDSKGFHALKGLAEDRYKLWKSIKYNDVWEKSH